MAKNSKICLVQFGSYHFFTTSAAEEKVNKTPPLIKWLFALVWKMQILKRENAVEFFFYNCILLLIMFRDICYKLPADFIFLTSAKYCEYIKLLLSLIWRIFKNIVHSCFKIFIKPEKFESLENFAKLCKSLNESFLFNMGKISKCIHQFERSEFLKKKALLRKKCSVWNRCS